MKKQTVKTNKEVKTEQQRKGESKMKVSKEKGSVAVKAGLAATGVLGTIALFKKEYRKAIVAGMATGVVSGLCGKALVKQAMKQEAIKSKVDKVNEVVETFKENFNEAYEAKMAEMVEEMLEEEVQEVKGNEEANDTNSEGSSENNSNSGNNELKKEFDEYRDSVDETLDELIALVNSMNNSMIEQKKGLNEVNKVVSETVKDTLEIFGQLTGEFKTMRQEVLGNKAVTEDMIKKYIDDNKKVILEEMGITGSDLIAHIDTEKFSNEAIMAATMEIVGNNFVDVVVERVNQQMVAIMRKEIKETGIAKDLDDVKAFIEVIKEGKQDNE